MLGNFNRKHLSNARQELTALCQRIQPRGRYAGRSGCWRLILLKSQSGIGEKSRSGLSDGEWRRPRRIAKIRRPGPVGDLRQVLEILANVRAMLVEFPVEPVDHVRSFRP